MTTRLLAKQMRITRAGTQPSQEGPAGWFTGADGKVVEWMEKVTDEQYGH